jgi:tetratricopeptide (TPR) repeat protein
LIAVLALAAAAGYAHPEIEAAVALLNARIAAAPGDATLYLERGELYAQHSEWVEAEANYLRAAELDPHHPRLARVRGALELATGHPAAARKLLDAAIAQNPRDAEALVLRSRAAAAVHDRPAALADLATALTQLSAPPPELFLERAALLDGAEAVRSLDAAIERIGPAITLHLRAAALEESLGRIDDAAARFERLAAQSERKEQWLKRRGDLYARAGRPAEARAAYASALAALKTLPSWLRESSELTQLAAELTLLTKAAF